MALWQGRSKRKPSGGRLTAHKKKRKHELGRDPPPATVGDDERFRTVRTRGGNTRTRVLETNTANVQVPSEGETVQAEILTVAENPANPHYVRRNIVTKGAVLETSEGPARVTSRPGQDGVVNAVLVDDE
jgi:small subunit ribosomal protein S8e